MDPPPIIVETTGSESSFLGVWYSDLRALSSPVGISPKPQEGIQRRKGGDNLLEHWRDILIKAKLPKNAVRRIVGVSRTPRGRN